VSKHQAGRRLLVLLLLPLALAAGCATTVQLSSSPPGVKIYDGAEGKELGTTPVTLTEEMVKTEVSGGYLVRLERQGYRKVWLWYPSGVRNLNVTVNLEPFRSTGGAGTEKVLRQFSKAQLDVLGAEMLALQADLLVGSKVEPERVDQLLKSNPEIGTSHYLSALLKLRQGDKDGAAKLVAEATRLSPEEPDYIILNRELGGAPANDGKADTPATGPGKAEGDGAP
jgi:hypothetical protein